ncbi:MAG: DUF1993 domain-containing protein [Polyangiales bacterium]
MYFDTIREAKKLLGQLDTWLERAASYAESKPFDPNVYLTLRLAPDQFPFVRQVQSACDVLKLGVSRLTGREAPSHPDTEKTLEELRARVRSTLAYVDGFSAKDFESSATRVIALPQWRGKVMHGSDYFLEHFLPNFFFHLSHSYAILRHNGVNLGKLDYLGAISLREP